MIFYLELFLKCVVAGLVSKTSANKTFWTNVGNCQDHIWHKLGRTSHPLVLYDACMVKILQRTSDYRSAIKSVSSSSKISPILLRQLVILLSEILQLSLLIRHEEEQDIFVESSTNLRPELVMCVILSKDGKMRVDNNMDHTGSTLDKLIYLSDLTDENDSKVGKNKSDSQSCPASSSAEISINSDVGFSDKTEMKGCSSSPKELVRYQKMSCSKLGVSNISPFVSVDSSFNLDDQPSCTTTPNPQLFASENLDSSCTSTNTLMNSISTASSLSSSLSVSTDNQSDRYDTLLKMPTDHQEQSNISQDNAALIDLYECLSSQTLSNISMPSLSDTISTQYSSISVTLPTKTCLTSSMVSAAEPSVTQCISQPILQSQVSRSSKDSTKDSISITSKDGKSSLSSDSDHSDSNSSFSDDDAAQLSNLPITVEPSTGKAFAEIKQITDTNKSNKFTEEQLDQIKLASEILESGISWLQKVATHIFDPSKTCSGKCKLHCLRAIHKMTKKPRGKPPKRLKKN